jgi:hypothetical protein
MQKKVLQMIKMIWCCWVPCQKSWKLHSLCFNVYVPLKELEGMSTWMHIAPPRLASSEHWGVTMKFVWILAKTSIYLETLQKSWAKTPPITQYWKWALHACTNAAHCWVNQDHNVLHLMVCLPYVFPCLQFPKTSFRHQGKESGMSSEAHPDQLKALSDF